MGLNDNLEALYHFTGNANDSSGNGNNGTVNGATLTTDKNAVSNQAYNFDGTNDSISISDSSELNFGTGDFSISCWFNTTRTTAQTNGSMALIFKHNTSSPYQGYYFWVGSAGDSNQGKLYFRIRDGTGSSDSGYTPLAYNDGNWHHAVAVRTGNVLKIYVDGTEVISTSVTSRNVDNTGTLRLGQNNILGNDMFDGNMDEVRIYSRALTDYEIMQLYTGYDTDSDCVDTLTTGLESGYHFTGNANDFSGNGNNGTVNGAILTTDKNAVSNQAYSFDGSNDYISYTAIDDVQTISLWFSPDSDNPNAETLLDQRNDASPNAGWYLYLATNEIRVSNDIGASTQSLIGTSGTISASTWYHLVVVIDSVNGNKIYLNGTSLTLTTNTITGSSLQNSTSTAWMGGYSQTSSLFFGGKLDEIRIYSRALTTDEITLLYNGYDNPIPCPVTTVKKDSLFFGGGL